MAVYLGGAHRDDLRVVRAAVLAPVRDGREELLHEVARRPHRVRGPSGALTVGSRREGENAGHVGSVDVAEV